MFSHNPPSFYKVSNKTWVKSGLIVGGVVTVINILVRCDQRPQTHYKIKYI